MATCLFVLISAKFISSFLLCFQAVKDGKGRVHLVMFPREGGVDALVSLVTEQCDITRSSGGEKPLVQVTGIGANFFKQEIESKLQMTWVVLGIIRTDRWRMRKRKVSLMFATAQFENYIKFPTTPMGSIGVQDVGTPSRMKQIHTFRTIIFKKIQSHGWMFTKIHLSSRSLTNHLDTVKWHLLG